MGPHTTPSGDPPEIDDSEWEYEYHETETETFYVTLDLSAASFTTRTKKQSNVLDSPPAILADGALPGNEPIALVDEPLIANEPIPSTSDPKPEAHIQILDLETPNPLISYQGRLFAATWTTTLGTDILLASPSPNSISSDPPLKHTPGLDIIAATGIKIVGRPAQLIAHTEDRTKRASASTTPAVEVENGATEAGPSPLKIPVGPNASLAQQNQARFLERLAVAKAVKGERDSVKIHSKGRGIGTGWRAFQREKAAEAEESTENEEGEERQELSAIAENGASDDTGAALSTPKSTARERGEGGEPRAKKRRHRIHVPGGLFRDFTGEGARETGKVADFSGLATDTRGVGDPVDQDMPDLVATSTNDNGDFASGGGPPAKDMMVGAIDDLGG